MKRTYINFNLIVLVASGVLFGCGDSGYDESPNDTQKPNKLSLAVELNGSQQVPQAVQTPATGRQNSRQTRKLEN